MSAEAESLTLAEARKFLVMRHSLAVGSMHELACKQGITRPRHSRLN